MGCESSGGIRLQSPPSLKLSALNLSEGSLLELIYERFFAGLFRRGIPEMLPQPTASRLLVPFLQELGAFDYLLKTAAGNCYMFIP